MTLRPETRYSLTDAARALAADFGCALPYAKKALWVAVCRYVQPPGMTGDIVHSSINPTDVDMVFLELEGEWRRTPPPIQNPSRFPPNPSPPCPCRFCAVQIRWADLGGKRHPFNLNGTSHLDTCTSPRRTRRAAA